MTQSTLLPSIPASQASSPLANLWEQGLKNQEDSGIQVIRSDEPVPKTFVAPNFGEVTNWVPQDSAHPLYSSRYADLLREILLDYMTEEEVKPDDPRLSQPNGLEVTNLNGKPLTFTRDAAGINVNGVTVRQSKANQDGTASYILTESLFGHREKVHDVWREYVKTVPAYDPFGRPLGATAKLKQALFRRPTGTSPSSPPSWTLIDVAKRYDEAGTDTPTQNTQQHAESFTTLQHGKQTDFSDVSSAEENTHSGVA
ncbi:hypothetical protein GWK47_019434 [Chionoecetes opilio]|uniref:Uncharacterized protein n=1 Tax=Chionoecetes opilio TaxID=41210 RepID=A0A8J4XQB2_CHIOP|nr:hypothetical protein GWK47_019434 [Chionoecetes opilio]